MSAEEKSMYRVLLVEDDARLAELVTEYLSAYEFQVELVTRGDEALARFGACAPDIVVLDLMLPGLDGMVVCRKIRELSEVPILILTAREDSYDEVSGLEQGADDFVNKPVQPRVLLARLRAVYGPERVVDQLSVGTVSTPANWNDYVQRLINPNLKMISRGQLKIDGNNVSLRGDVANETQRQQIAGDIAGSLNPTYTVNNGLRVAATQQGDLDSSRAKRR